MRLKKMIHLIIQIKKKEKKIDKINPVLQLYLQIKIE